MKLLEGDWLNHSLWKKSSPSVAEITQGMLTAKVGTSPYPPISRQETIPVLPEVNKSASPKDSAGT